MTSFTLVMFILPAAIIGLAVVLAWKTPASHDDSTGHGQ
jgi:hypothetical protein